MVFLQRERETPNNTYLHTYDKMAKSSAENKFLRALRKRYKTLDFGGRFESPFLSLFLILIITTFLSPCLMRSASVRFADVLKVSSS